MPYDPAWSSSMQAYVFIQFMLLLDVYNNLLMDQTVGVFFFPFTIEIDIRFSQKCARLKCQSYHMYAIFHCHQQDL